MTNSISEATNPVILDAMSTRMMIGSILIVAVLLILWWAGPLKKLKTFSLNFFKNVRLNMGFHKPETARSEEGNRVAQNREAKKPRNVTALKSQINSVLAERKKVQKPLPSNFEEQRIAQGFKHLEAGQFIEAKKCFDSALQQNPKSVDGCFGLARVLELWGDVTNAMKYYWEAARIGDGNHPRAIMAQARLDELSKQERHQNMMKAVIKSGPTVNSFWFDGVPDGMVLARYFVALSNSEEGGHIVVGLDTVSRKPSGQNLGGWEKMLEAVRWHYVTAPCLFEVLRSEQPPCIVVLMQTGRNRPYRVNNDDDEEAKLFVVDGAGGVREATPEEGHELRKKKRG